MDARDLMVEVHFLPPAHHHEIKPWHKLLPVVPIVGQEVFREDKVYRIIEVAWDMRGRSVVPRVEVRLNYEAPIE